MARQPIITIPNRHEVFMVSTLILGAVLSLGQSQSAPSEQPAAPEAPPAPAPEQWLFMRSLQGTELGSVLQANRLEISGWVDASYTGSSAAHSNGPLGFNYRANEFLLDQNWVRVERTVVTTDSTEASFGFRCDTILPGSDYR